MKQLKNYADRRLLQGCIYCGARNVESKDHVPSKVFLDIPYPANLPVAPACDDCNNGFAQDEEYLACLIECTIAGTTDPENIRRQSIAKSLRKNTALRSRIERAKSLDKKRVFFAAEESRVENIVLKLAKGHVAFELGSQVHQPPTYLYWWPLTLMTAEQKETFDSPCFSTLFAEVGSRGLQRHVFVQAKLESSEGDTRNMGLIVNDWLDVQEGRYRYLASQDIEGIKIKIVIAEFLACEVFWAD